MSHIDFVATLILSPTNTLSTEISTIHSALHARRVPPSSWRRWVHETICPTDLHLRITFSSGCCAHRSTRIFFLTSICIRHHLHDQIADCLTHWRPDRRQWLLSTDLVIINNVRTGRRLSHAVRNKQLSHCFAQALLARFDSFPTDCSLVPARLVAPPHATSAGPLCRSSNLSSKSLQFATHAAVPLKLFLQNNSGHFTTH